VGISGIDGEARLDFGEGLGFGKNLAATEKPRDRDVGLA